MTFKVPECFRIVTGPMATARHSGNNGCFVMGKLRIIASDGAGWEHVSVSLPNRTPTWDEMCKVKDAFWGEDDVVLQFHPAKKEYVNYHPHCLHLWRKSGVNEETPPSIMVGLK